ACVLVATKIGVGEEEILPRFCFFDFFHRKIVIYNTSAEGIDILPRVQNSKTSHEVASFGMNEW
ncbi:hypothetical protein LRR74_28570, partial [Klebsiella pneumoniae]|nr:hypothetical protein [Klebsiella pneumoniae]